MPIDFEYILLLLVAILPIFYKLSFWLYTIQLKEYRFDRFKEYMATRQWKSAYFNFWFLIEFPILFSTIAIFFDRNLEIIIFPTLFYFFVIQNIFVFWKIIRNRILKPKITSRLLLTKLIVVFFILLNLYFVVFWWFEKYIFIYLFILIFFTPIYIFVAIFISLPIVNYLKRKKIKNATEKLKKYNNIIKVWITWSYWKSSVKEYLSSILYNESKILKTPENINTELWISDLILRKISKKYKYFIAEMWAYRIWEIKVLWNIVDHKYWFLTAIWNQHIWLFWNQKNIIKAKSEISNSVLINNWILYINWNNKNIKKIKFQKWLNMIKYWTDDWCDAKSTFNKISWTNFVFDFEYKNIKETFETNLIGDHNVINLTWVIAFCIDLWLNIKNIKKYLLKIKSPKNTLTLINKKINKLNLKIINDTYNISYDWLFAGIKLLNYYEKDYEKILILDDVIELWKDAKSIHYNIWLKVAKSKILDKIVYVWINYKKEFTKWLIDWWFDKKNILSNIKTINKNTIILLEWRWAWKFNFFKK